MSANAQPHTLRAGMVGMGMIFDETYRPMFEALHADGLYRRDFGYVDVALAAVATRTGARARAYKKAAGGRIADFTSFEGADSVEQAIAAGVDFVCVATPDDRHFDAAKQAILAGRHVLIEKPSVLELAGARRARRRSRGRRASWRRSSITSCSTPITRSCARSSPTACCSTSTTATARCSSRRRSAAAQFAEWITGRNPGTYVAVHYIKLIDFTFGGRLKTVAGTGQRGLVGPADGTTWDSTQLRMVYEYPDGREAAFDIHTSWVTPTTSPATSSRKCSSASTTASGTATRGSAASS